jgi:hypothetical protein
MAKRQGTETSFFPNSAVRHKASCVEAGRLSGAL